MFRSDLPGKLGSVKKWILLPISVLIVMLLLEGSAFLIFKARHGIGSSLPAYIFSSSSNLYPHYSTSKGFAKYTYIRGYDSFRGYRLEPNSKVVDNLSDVPTVLETDGFGFIHNGKDTENRDYEQKKEGVVRIFMLGGSSLAGVGAANNENTIAAILENELNSQLSKDQIKTFEVINAGVLGYQTSLELIYLIQEIVHFHPDLIICFDGINDKEGIIESNSKEGYVIPHRKTYHENIARHLTKGPFISINPNATYLTWFMSGLARKIPHVFTQHNQTPKQEHLSLLPKNIAIYEKNLKSLAGIAYGHKLKMLLVLQPNVYSKKSLTSSEKKYFDEWHSYRNGIIQNWFRAIRDVFKKVGAENTNPNVVLLDFHNMFDDVREKIYVDRGHYNRAGNVMIARRLAAEILRLYAYGNNVS